VGGRAETGVCGKKSLVLACLVRRSDGLNQGSKNEERITCRSKETWFEGGVGKGRELVQSGEVNC